MFELMAVIYKIFITMLGLSFAKLLLGESWGVQIGWVYYIILAVACAFLLIFWRRFKRGVRAGLSIFVLLLGMIQVFFPLSLSQYTFAIGFLFGIASAFMDKSLHHGVRLLTLPIRGFYKDREIKGWHFLVLGLLYIPLSMVMVLPMYFLLTFPSMIAPDFWNNVILPMVFLGDVPSIHCNFIEACFTSYVGYLFGVAGSYAMSYLTGSEIMEDVEPLTYAYPEVITHNLKFVDMCISGIVAFFLPLTFPIVRIPLSTFFSIFFGEGFDLASIMDFTLNLAICACLALIIGVIIYGLRGNDVVFG
jgi:hypothetical protein